MKTVIFLDIDGVLVPKAQDYHYEIDETLPARLAIEKRDAGIRSLDPALVSKLYHNFDRQSCALIAKLCEDFGAGIIVTSSWRNVYTYSQLRSILSIADLGRYVLGVTPLGCSRRDVVRRAVETLHPDSYVVIDDLDLSRDHGYRSICPESVFNKNSYNQTRRVLNYDR